MCCCGNVDVWDTAQLYVYVIKMGGWKLEIGKMAMYVSFPVILFYFFNQPKYFEDWVVRMRRELYPPLDKMHKQEIEECIRRIHERKEKELFKDLEEEEEREMQKKL